MDTLLTKEDIAKRYKCTLNTVTNRINSGALPQPMRIGGTLYWRKTAILAFEDRKMGAAPSPAREPSVTIVDGAPEATKIARAIATTGRLPEKCRSDWRTPFGHCEKRLPPRELQALFGLNDYADWLDVADAIERRIKPPSNNPPYGFLVDVTY